MKSAVFWGITQYRVVIVVNNCHTMPRNTPEDRGFHQHRGGSLKSTNVCYILYCSDMF
jgi:hypothetical protein